MGLSAEPGLGDNLGNHTATQDLNINTFNIVKVGSITANAAITTYSSMTVAGNGGTYGLNVSSNINVAAGVFNTINGNVGIGTTGPGFKLDINGSIRTGGGVATHFYNASYGIPAATAVTINLYDGVNTLQAGYQYRVRLVTEGTGTPSGAVYIIYRTAVGTWAASLVSANGTTSNHPLLQVTGTAVQIYHNHPAYYSVGVFVEGFQDGNVSGPSASTFFGLEGAMTNLSGNVGISTNAPEGRLDVKAAGSAATDMAQIWRNSGGTIVSSVSATGVMMATKFVGDGTGLSGVLTAGDNLGNHTATQDLKMNTFNIVNVGSITANAAITTYSSMTIVGNGGSYGLSVSSNIIVAGGVFNTANGNVGIGTTAPANKLHVEGAVGASAGIYLNNAVPSAISNTLYNNAGTLTWNGTALAASSSVSGTIGYLPKFTSASALGNSVLFESGGNVGVGTTSPAFKLDVNGDIRYTGKIVNNAGIKTYAVTIPQQSNTNSTYEIMRIGRDAANWSFQMPYEVTVYNTYYRGGVTKWFINYNQVDSGSVAATESNGLQPLKLYLGAEVNVGGNIYYRPVLVDLPNYEAMGIEVKYNTSEVGSITNASQVQFTGTLSAGSGANYNGNIQLASSGGNVGIGTAAPGYKLDVSGTLNATTIYQGGATLASLYAPLTGGGNYVQLQAATPGTLQTGHLNISGSGLFGGSVGIGTTAPGKKLDVVGTTETSIRVADTGGASLELYQQAVDSYLISTNAMRIYTNGSQQVVIKAGNVGIGMTEPAAKLNVASSGLGDAGGLRLTNTGSGGDDYRIWPTATINGEGAGKLIITNNGGNRVVVDSNGNVGIGTVAPKLKTEISGAYSNPAVSGSVPNGVFAITTPDVYRGLYFGFATASPYAAWLQSAPWNDFSSVASLAINPNGGNVGIGTVAPGQKLEVSGGNINIPYAVSKTNGYMLNLGNDIGYIWRNYAYADDGLFISQNWYRNDAGDANIIPNAGHSTEAIQLFRDGTIRFLTGGTNTAPSARMLIDSAGNVGIGTTAPAPHNGSNALIIKGAATGASRGIVELWDGVSGKSVFQNVGGDTYIGQLDKGTGAGSLFLLTGGNGANATTAMTLLAGGNVGIGTTNPTHKLDVNGSISLSPLANTNYSLDIYSNGQTASQVSLSQGWSTVTDNIGYLYNRANADLILGTNNLERIRITAGGNVGIGTAGPGVKLDVVGGSIRTDTQLISAVASGTPPLSVNSPTLVTNLNADMLDGLHTSSFYTSGSFTVGGTSSNFYPVQFTGSVYSASSDLILYRNQVHENGTWYGTFNFMLSFHPMNYGNWSVGQIERIIYQTGSGGLGLLGYHDPVGDVADGSAAGGGSDVIIWLRGGGTYHWRNAQVTAPWTLSNGNSGGGSITDSSGNTRDAIASQSTLILNAKNRFYTSMGLGTAGDLYVAGNVGIGTTSPGAKLQVAGDIIGNAQVFRAYLTSDFAHPSGWVKIPFNATLFNTLQGTFDTALNRFTASRSGYYRISVTGYSATAGTGTERYAIGVYKNAGLEGFTGGNYSNGDTPLSGLAATILYLNGSTDYVEIWAYSAITATWKGGNSGGHCMYWYMDYVGS